MDISRPTLYKFVEYYDNGQLKQIKNSAVLNLFHFITKNKKLSKKEIISYIADGKIHNFNDGKSFSFHAKPDSAQFNLLNLIQTYVNDTYDENNYTQELGKLLLFIDDIASNKKLSEEEKNKIQNIIQQKKRS